MGYKNTLKLYGLPKKVIYCKTCTTSLFVKGINRKF